MPAYSPPMGFLPPVSSFEICYYRGSGSVSLIMTINAFSPDGAALIATRMLRDGLPYAVVWDGLAEVATLHHTKPN
jgi:hypothetical protein